MDDEDTNVALTIASPTNVKSAPWGGKQATNKPNISPVNTPHTDKTTKKNKHVAKIVKT